MSFSSDDSDKERSPSPRQRNMREKKSASQFEQYLKKEGHTAIVGKIWKLFQNKLLKVGNGRNKQPNG